MKKIFLFAMVAAALSGCSNSDDTDVQSEVQPGGEGYVGFSIQLPTVPGTRANDEFEDGTPVPDEYKVHNATMFIFKGTTEASATFDNAYEMNVNTFVADGTSTDQCTTEGIVSSKITKPETISGENIYAYVMINSNDMINTTAKTIDGISYEAKTFAEFSKIALTKLGDLTKGLVMTNAPVADKMGGTSDPETAGATISTLARLDANKIFATQAAAEKNPAGEVYMERAAAKVTVKKGSMTDTITTPGETVTYDPNSIKWTLSNVNTKYYNTRQMSSDWLSFHAQGVGVSDPNIEGIPNPATLYRFVSGTAIHTGVYRTYWGTDVNYDSNETFSAPGTIDENPGTSVYTFENTFDVDHQIVKYSTGVAVSATFNGGDGFYTADTYGANKILQEPEYSGSEEKIQDYIMKYLCNNYTKFKDWYDVAGGANRITVTMNNADPTNAKVATVTKVSGAADLPAGFGETEIMNALDHIKFQYYAGGVAYYNVLIKHFGDVETPWKRENHTVNSITGVYRTIGSTSLSDDLANNNYLGRYGVVRNNWYQIKITGIRQIGSPTISGPVGGGDPDDNVDNYLSVKIHITPWAVRTQSVEL
ncbi:MAG: fimbria major subunit [Bacteroidaceae bacterium]